MNAKRVRLVATARFLHDGRWVYPGVSITAGEAEAADLCALHFARVVATPQRKNPPKKPIVTNVEIPLAVEPSERSTEEETTRSRIDTSPSSSRSYRRRDLQAEE